MQKTLADIDEALAVQRATEPPLEESRWESGSKSRSYPQSDRTFGIYRTKDEEMGMVGRVVELYGDKLYVENNMYRLTPGLNALITYRRPRHEEYNDDDYTTTDPCENKPELCRCSWPIQHMELESNARENVFTYGKFTRRRRRNG